MFKKCIIIVSLLLTLTVSAGCSNTDVPKYKKPEKMKDISSGVFVENENYQLEYDNDTKCVLFKDLKTEKIWSTTPYDYYMSGESSYSMSSPIIIDYLDLTDNSVQTIKALDCIDENTVSAEKKKNSLYVTYYFSEAKIKVTISYSIRDDALVVGFKGSDVVDSKNSKLLNVSLLPYLCSTKNSNTHDNYLFVPSGNGALMYTSVSSDGDYRSFSQEIYGNDAAREMLDKPGDEEPIRLPVFGVKDYDNSLFAIIEKGSGAAKIEAIAGNQSTEYSTVYPVFNVRGYNNIEWDTGLSAGMETANDAIIVNETLPETTEFSVSYHPLSKNESNYSGMASCYKDYLKKSDSLKKSNIKQDLFHMTIVGGAQQRKFLFGIPYDTYYSMTTFSQAEEIVNDIIKSVGDKPSVMLEGFGTSGMFIKNIAGNYKFSSKAGSKKDFNSLLEFCKSNKSPFYVDYNIIQFTKSSKFSSKYFDISQTANGESVSAYPLKVNLRMSNTDKDKVLFVKRDNINDIANRVIKKNSDISGVGFTSYGKTAYSDYSNEKYMLKQGIEEQTKEIFSDCKNNNKSVITSAANYYAAGISDCIIDTPLSNGGYNSLDEIVPFYQMVFKGYIPLYSVPINLISNSDDIILRAIESGVSLQFTVSHNIDKSLATSNEISYYGLKYSDNKNVILSSLKKTEDVYNKIKDAEIVNHFIIQDGVTKTVFSNKINVIVNFTNDDKVIDGKTIKKRSFLCEAE